MSRKNNQTPFTWFEKKEWEAVANNILEHRRGK